MNQRAITYRKLHNVPEWWGTAINVQAMVFGTAATSSGARQSCRVGYPRIVPIRRNWLPRRCSTRPHLSHK